jgi:large subunit ribosomal protein L15
MNLNQITDNTGARQDRKRVGRGIASGTGKTCGRGVKGQKSRTGVAIKGFEGGQMPLYQRLPKRGFNNIFSKDLNEVNLDRLQQAVDAKKLDPKKPVTEQALVEAGIIRRLLDGTRILGNGEIKVKLDLHVTGASKSAVAAVEKAGGKITIAEVKTTTPKAEKRLSGEEKKPAAEKKAPAKKAEAKEPAAEKPAPKKAPAKKEDKE